MKRWEKIILAGLIMVALCLIYVMAWAAETNPKVGDQDMSTILWAFGGLQTIQILLLGWIKLDNRDLWKRANSHGHRIKFEKKGCNNECVLVTEDVVIKGD
jgi:hypothetical protein